MQIPTVMSGQVLGVDRLNSLREHSSIVRRVKNNELGEYRRHCNRSHALLTF